ncbi:MAG: TonB-dependent receptor, partial [Bacteroidetes bacterium]|nr:TonB-dependent receptor [Bacteroidota bacterium]
MRRLLFIICIILNISFLSAQVHTISGFVEDARSGEKLINANIYDSKTLKGTISNIYGFYSLTLPEGEIELIYSFVGYTQVQKQINLTEDIIINISLEPSIELQEVTITDKSVQSKVRSTQMSKVEIPVKTIKNLPVLLGEVDIIKTIQLLPGVQSGSEGASGLYVRGGGPDQNLVLLDGVPVYNVNHLFGFFSVFNADAINTVSLTKGGFPARYGGRLSSVLDIRMKEGNTKEIKGEGSVGIISSKLAIEGPIIKDKTSFIVSGRRTYIDILSYPVQYFIAKSEDIDKLRAGYYFYDLNAKINHKFSDKSRLYLSSYMGNDKVYTVIKDISYDFKEENKFKLRWGNITSALRWNYIINNKLFSNTT